jgi:hypothetical protein
LVRRVGYPVGAETLVPTFKDLYSVARLTPTTRAMSATVVPPAS